MFDILEKIFHLADDLQPPCVLPMALHTDGLQPAYRTQIHIQNEGMILNTAQDYKLI